MCIKRSSIVYHIIQPKKSYVRDEMSCCVRGPTRAFLLLVKKGPPFSFKVIYETRLPIAFFSSTSFRQKIYALLLLNITLFFFAKRLLFSVALLVPEISTLLILKTTDIMVGCNCSITSTERNTRAMKRFHLSASMCTVAVDRFFIKNFIKLYILYSPDHLFRSLQNISDSCWSYQKTKASLLCPSTIPLLLNHISAL